MSEPVHVPNPPPPVITIPTTLVWVVSLTPPKMPCDAWPTSVAQLASAT
jgi:hypothetical protein